MRRIAAVLVSLMLASAVPAAAQAPVSLASAVETALARHPAVVAARENLKAAEARLAQVRAGRGITIVFTGSAAYGNASNIPPGGSPTTTTSGTLSAQLPLVNLQIQHQIRQAEASVSAAKAAFVQTQQDTALAAGQAYLTVLRRQAVVAVREASVAQADAQVRLAEAQVRAGVAARADVLQAQAQLAGAQVDLLAARGDVESGLASLSSAMGLPLGEEIALGAVAPAPAITLSREQAIAAAGERPEVTQARAAAAQAEAALALAEVQARPLAAVNATSTLDLVKNPGQITWSVSATVTYGLIDGGRAKAAVAEAKANLAAARARESQTLGQVQLDALVAWIASQGAVARVSAARVGEDAAAEALRAAEGRYRAGVASIVEVITARTTSLAASLARVQAEFDVQASVLALRHALGRPIVGGAL